MGLFLLQMKNIKLYEYLLLSDDEMVYYNNVFQFIKEENKIGNYEAKDLTSLTFGEVALVKKLAVASDYQKVFHIVFGIEEKELLNIRVKEFFMALNWLRNNLDALIEREKFLVGDEDLKMVEAGSARLNVFKEMNVIIPLSKDYGKTPEEIESWKYSTIFTIMYYEKISREVEKEYNRLTIKK